MSEEQTAIEKVSSSLAKRSGKGAAAANMMEMLERAKPAIANALPKHLTAERMVRIAYGAVSRSPRLLECDPASIVRAVVESSELGLEPTGILGHSYLVPYRNNKTRKMEAQLQVGYRGFIELAGRSGRLEHLRARVVYEGEDFIWEEGLEPKLVHVPVLNRDPSAKPVAVYATAKFIGGGVAFEVLSIDDVEKRRKSSRARDSGPWVTHWDEMARKSAVRALAKYLPLSPELTTAAVRDELTEQGLDREAVSVDFEVVDADGVVEEGGE